VIGLLIAAFAADKPKIRMAVIAIAVTIIFNQRYSTTTTPTIPIIGLTAAGVIAVIANTLEHIPDIVVLTAQSAGPLLAADFAAKISFYPRAFKITMLSALGASNIHQTANNAQFASHIIL
jgi:hypothetical protein